MLLPIKFRLAETNSLDRIDEIGGYNDIHRGVEQTECEINSPKKCNLSVTDTNSTFVNEIILANFNGKN